MFLALIIILAVYAVAILLSLVTKEGRLAWRLVCARVKYIFPTTKRAFYENDDITIVFKRILVISIELFCGVMLGLFYVIVSFVIPVMPYIYMHRFFKRESTYKFFAEEYLPFGIYKRVKRVSEWFTDDAQTHILLSRDFPLPLSPEQVIYVEDKYHPRMNKFIRKHYNEIQELLRHRNFDFYYLPVIEEEGIAAEAINYMFPYQHTETNYKSKEKIDLDIIKKYIVKGEIKGPALLHYRATDAKLPPISPLVPRAPLDKELVENYYLSYRELSFHYKTSLSDQFVFYSNNTTRQPIGADFSLAHCEYEKKLDADDLFDAFATTIAHEIQVRIFKLRQFGFKDAQIRALIEETPTLSKLVITEDFHIFLPDYNNIEIKMSPLPKAIFFLFLIHPEGILFKNLVDYREEVLDIYKQFTSREDYEKVLESIDKLVDPMNNSINEKCSRIREAFLSKFDIRYAEHYLVEGKRGEAKKITLPRELVVWNSYLSKLQGL